MLTRTKSIGDDKPRSVDTVLYIVAVAELSFSLLRIAKENATYKKDIP